MIKITAADRYFSLCVRQRSNWSCERCHKGYSPPTTALHCAHVFSRGNWSVRFDPMNAFALCMGCHLYTTGRPVEFRDWVAARIGLPELERLERTAKKPAHGIKKQLKAIAAHYRAEHDRQKLGGHFAGWAG